MIKGRIMIFAGMVAVGAMSPYGASAGETVDAIKANGFLQCGGHTGLPGFSAADDQGNWEGLDVDTCRAVAAAILGDAAKVKFTPLTPQQRFTALQSGEIDILSRSTTWTMSRDTKLGVDFVGVNFYDGQGFLVANALGVDSVAGLNGATVCVEPGTTTELNLSDYFRANNLSFEPVVIENLNEATAAFFAGRCDVYTTDSSGLASIRQTMAPNPADYKILPEVISKEPLGPVVRHGDQQFGDIARWSLLAMVQAEEFGITSENVENMKASDNPGIKRLLGVSPGMGEGIGLGNELIKGFR